ncbi:MAG TPA: MqnA/MqnD/SBP family protein [Planctomycetota bacterium]
MSRTITLAHSPDSDDAFMFYALAKGKVDTRGYKFEHVLKDIETLNRDAIKGTYDITAVSFHAYYKIRKQYRLMSAGASVGDGYGPLIVSKRSMTRVDLDEATVAVPGELTTAFLIFRLYCPQARWKVMPFDKIQDAVAKGDIDAGLLIHEGQLTYREQKLHRVADLGEWWKHETSLPLPLGGNALRRSLDKKAASACCDVLRDTVQYALDHRKDALDHALEYARGMDRKKADKFVGMYVNGYTLELGERAEQAISLMYKLGHQAGLIPVRLEPEFID